ncbi:MAG: hypothetical protein HZB20_03795 [Chloroflexi bacterium]|nr:hypothetical protein [Chloroflexota bacterium]
MNLRSVWQALAGADPTAEGNRFRLLRHNFFFHLRPAAVPLHAIRHTLCLGGVTILLFLVETVTGSLLMFYYVPSPAEAYPSTVAITTTVPYGNVIRNMQRLAAEGMVLTVLLHMTRVFVTGSYQPPRRRAVVAGDAGVQFHRLFAALGSTVVLGDHHRHQRCRGRAVDRVKYSADAAGRAERGRGGLAALLRVARLRAAYRADHWDQLPYL